MSENIGPPPQSPPPPPQNPYQGNASGGFPHNRAEALGKLKAPAIVMIIIAVLAMITSIPSLFVDPSQMVETYLEFLEPYRDQIEESGQNFEQFQDSMRNMIGGTSNRVFTILHFIMLFVIIAGAWKMFKGQSYPLAITAAVLSSIPCIGPCCCLGMIPGIWSLIVLLSSDVRAAFD